MKGRKAMKWGLMMLWAWISTFTMAADRTVRVNPDERLQTIDHFTASDAWSGALVGRYWPEAERQQIATWLFSQETDGQGHPKGIGLSLWRVNTGAGTWEQPDCDIQPIRRRAEAFMTTDAAHYDWGKCAGQLYFMKQAVALGCNSFLLFSNSPLVQWTRNGKGYSDVASQANLRPECYAPYGNYLATVADHLIRSGFHIRFISPINEPQVDWVRPTQEGSPWRVGEMKQMYTALDQAMQSYPSLDEVQILVGEASNVPQMYRTDANCTRQFGSEEEAPHRLIQAFFDEQSPYCLTRLKHVPRLIGGHTYHYHSTHQEIRTTRSPMRDTCARYHVHYYQTEWCLLPYGEEQIRRFDGFTPDWKAGNHADIQAALLMGRLIYADLVCSGAEAWGYWKGMELNGDHALINLQADGNNLLKGGHAVPNKLLWALGNYSLFIRPGYQRVAVEGAESLETLCGSAYRSPDGRQLVLVFVNSGFEAEQVRLELPKSFRRNIRQVSIYQTDADHDLSRVGQSGQLPASLTVAPRSLVTVTLLLSLQKPLQKATLS